jgi:hypothetical protein
VGSLRSLFTSGSWEHLAPTDASGSFRHDDETVSSRFFTQSEAGAPVLVTQMGYYEKANQLVAEARRRIVQLALLVLVTGAVLIPLALIRALGLDLPGLLSGVPGLAILVPAALQTLVALGTWIVLMRTNHSLGEMNASSLGAFIASLAFPALAAATLGLSIRQLWDGDVGLIYRAYLLLFGAAGGCLTLLAWAARWIGLRTWAY